LQWRPILGFSGSRPDTIPDRARRGQRLISAPLEAAASRCLTSCAYSTHWCQRGCDTVSAADRSGVALMRARLELGDDHLLPRFNNNSPLMALQPVPVRKSLRKRRARKVKRWKL
jgi:hypothetical protein